MSPDDIKAGQRYVTLSGRVTGPLEWDRGTMVDSGCWTDGKTDWNRWGNSLYEKNNLVRPYDHMAELVAVMKACPSVKPGSIPSSAIGCDWLDSEWGRYTYDIEYRLKIGRSMQGMA